MLSNEEPTALFSSGSTVTTVASSMIPFTFFTTNICLLLPSISLKIHRACELNVFTIFQFHLKLIFIFYWPFFSCAWFNNFNLNLDSKMKIRKDPISFVNYMFLTLFCAISQHSSQYFSTN